MICSFSWFSPVFYCCPCRLSKEMWFRIISSSMDSLLIPLLTAFCASQHFLISFSSSDLTRIVDCIWLISKSTCPVSANFSGLLSKQGALQSSGAAISTLFSHGHSGVSSYHMFRPLLPPCLSKRSSSNFAFIFLILLFWCSMEMVPAYCIQTIMYTRGKPLLQFHENWPQLIPALGSMHTTRLGFQRRW